MSTRYILLATTLFAMTATAVIAQPVATYDPQQLPAIQGQVAQYSLTPRGDVDGVILQDGTQVHLPPHLGAQLVQAVKPGDTVTIRGLKAQALPLIQCFLSPARAARLSSIPGRPRYRRSRSRWPISG
jgi:hypothetical protein